ncbi:MAG: AI-2E family transporter [Patescibacteria group bacterium]
MIENGKKVQSYFLVILIVGVLAITFFIFRAFLQPLVLASVAAFIFQPLNQKILRFFGGRGGFASFCTTIIIIAFILVPLTFLGIQIFGEAKQVYSYLSDGGGKNEILNIVEGVVSDLHRIFPSTKELSINIDEYLKQGLNWLIQNLNGVFSSFARIIVSSFIFLIALYYLLKDGHKFRKAVIDLSPLSDANDEAIFERLSLAVSSVIKGNLVIALIQGIVATIGFAIFSVPNPFLLGTVAAIAALIPGFGTALVLTPAVIFLFLSGESLLGFGLLAWGAGAVGLVDNLLGPRLIGRGMKLHPLFVLLSVIGGIGFFGPIGFILGPLVLSLLFSLFETYHYLEKK